MTLTRTLRTSRCVVALALFLLPIAGCPDGSGKGTAAEQTAFAAKGPPTETYTIRGKIEELPEKGKPQREFKVHHEAIDTFVGSKGDVVGMNAMTMAFPPAPGVSIEGLAVGDIVELTFAVWRKDGRFEWFTTAIKKLPSDTELVFRKAQRPLAPSGGVIPPPQPNDGK